MTITLDFNATITAPAAGNCLSLCEPAHLGASLSLVLDWVTTEYGEAFAGGYELASVAAFARLEAVRQLDELRFIAISLAEGQTADVYVLIGAPPQYQGEAGVFPLAAGGTFQFDLETFDVLGGATRISVATTLILGDTALQAAARINGAALLAGATSLVATVVGGQILLTGDVPGALEAIAITDDFPELGFAALGETFGTGTPMLIDRVFVASFSTGADLTGDDVWVKGGAASLRYVAAGS